MSEDKIIKTEWKHHKICSLDKDVTIVGDLTNSTLFSEWGRPIINNLDKKRYTTILLSQIACKINNLTIEEGNENIELFGDITPFGPYGDLLREALENKTVSFMLRILQINYQKEEKKKIIIIAIDAISKRSKST